MAVLMTYVWQLLDQKSFSCALALSLLAAGMSGLTMLLIVAARGYPLESFLFALPLVELFLHIRGAT